MAREGPELPDEQWARLAPLLPPQKPRTGRPSKDHRTVVEGICWVLRTGAPWRDLPARFGPWHTAASRFYRWWAAGVWDRGLAALQAAAERGRAPEAEALGRGRGGFSTKLHVRAEGAANYLAIVVIAAILLWLLV